MSSTNRTFKLRVWRQNGPKDKGHFEKYDAKDITPDMSFLEMLDVVNEGLIHQGKEPITFESDCREGICGSCGFMVNGLAHGPDKGATICQVHMRHFEDGETIVMEPWRAKAFPIVKDLMVDRSSFDRVIAAGGYVSVKTGSAPEANQTPIPREDAEEAFDFAACIGCGACVAQCKNASAALFTGAKISHLALTPQGKVERGERALAITIKADDEGFGSCSNEGECEAVCPKEISIKGIAFMNREVIKSVWRK